MNKQDKVTNIGSAMNQYRETVEMAFTASQELEAQGFERPWVVVKCEKESCSLHAVVGLNSSGLPTFHTHRIRLEIR